MSTFDTLADLALRAGVRTFKTAGIYTRAADQDNPISLDGVFDRVHKSVDPETGASVDSRTPTYGIALDDLPAAPDAGDQLEIETGRFAGTYEVLQSQEDGQGGTMLILAVKT
jgi:hypothetical protein